MIRYYNRTFAIQFESNDVYQMQEVCVQYWPEKDKQVYGNLTVSNVGEQELNDSLCTRIFEVYHNGSLCAVSL